MALRKISRYYSRRRRIRRFDIKKARSKIVNFLPPVILLAFIAGCIFLSLRWVNNFFRTSEFFNVSKIELTMKPMLKDALGLDFYGIPRGTNIFRINIETLSANTRRKHPEFASVTSSRRPPNVISVKIEYRQPFVFLRVSPRKKFLYGKQQVVYVQKDNFCLVPVSADRVVLPPAVDAGKVLPIISGVDLQPSVIRVGDVCSDRKLPYGIKLMAYIQDMWPMKNQKIEIIDLTDLKDVFIVLENSIYVKMGDCGVRTKEKIMSLKSILEDARFDHSKIAYIDVRFSDVIIGPKVTDELTKK